MDTYCGKRTLDLLVSGAACSAAVNLLGKRKIRSWIRGTSPDPGSR
jgi:hypothetical protein